MVAKAICDLVSGSWPAKVLRMPARDKTKFTTECLFGGPIERLGCDLKPIFFEHSGCPEGREEGEHNYLINII